MNEKLNKKLAEWAGLDWELSGLDEFEDEYGCCQPYFTQSLDACFKWLVPKLQDKGITVDLYGYEHNGFAVNLVSIFPVDATGFCPSIGGAVNDNPSLALCLAIEKLIDSSGGRVSSTALPPERS